MSVGEQCPEPVEIESNTIQSLLELKNRLDRLTVSVLFCSGLFWVVKLIRTSAHRRAPFVSPYSSGL